MKGRRNFRPRRHDARQASTGWARLPPEPDISSLPLSRLRRAGLTVAAWAPAALLTLGGAFAAADVEFAPGDSTRLVAVFPPWWSAERALAAASEVAAVSGVGGLGFAVGVVSDRPDLARALSAHGAVWVVDGRSFPACFAASRETQRP